MIDHNLRYSLSALVFALALLPASLPAALVQTGSVTPDINTWNSTVTVDVGDLDAGSATINGGSVVDTRNAFIRTLGAATVTGAGSTWTNHNQLSVEGALTIEAGGKVSTPRTWLGGGSAGVATVTGTGSEWTTTTEMLIDFKATLTIDAGGQVISPGGYLGAHEKGTATVTGAGSTWTNNGLLFVGIRGDGTLTIEAGGQVTSRGGELGYGLSFVTPEPNWVGRVTVRGGRLQVEQWPAPCRSKWHGHAHD